MRIGSDIVWRGNGPVFRILSGALCLLDSEWRRRKWKGWHTGFIEGILDTGEVLTCEAVADGIHIATYESVEDMGDCRIYDWLDDNSRVQEYAEAHEGDPYDGPAYLWTIIAFFCEKIFRWKFRIVNRAYTCWENTSQKDRYCGQELQPEEEFPLINKMMKKWEGYDGMAK